MLIAFSRLWVARTRCLLSAVPCDLEGQDHLPMEKDRRLLSKEKAVFVGKPGVNRALTYKAPVFGAKRRGIIVESLAPCQALRRQETSGVIVSAGTGNLCRHTPASDRLGRGFLWGTIVIMLKAAHHRTTAFRAAESGFVFPVVVFQRLVGLEFAVANSTLHGFCVSCLRAEILAKVLPGSSSRAFRWPEVHR